MADDEVAFDTKVAIPVLDDLLTWQKLNVAAFLATGIAGAAPEAMGEAHEDAAGRRHAALLGQPTTVHAADAATRAAFRAEQPDAPDLVGLALRETAPERGQGDQGGAAPPLTPPVCGGAGLG